MIIELDEPASMPLVAHWQGGTCSEPPAKTWRAAGDEGETLVLGTLPPSETSLERLFRFDLDYYDGVDLPIVFWEGTVPDSGPVTLHHVKLTSEDEPGVTVACGDIDMTEMTLRRLVEELDELAANATPAEQSQAGAEQCPDQKKPLAAPGKREPVTKGLPVGVKVPDKVCNLIPWDEGPKGKEGKPLSEAPPGTYSIAELERLGFDTTRWYPEGAPICPPRGDDAGSVGIDPDKIEEAEVNAALADEYNWYCVKVPWDKEEETVALNVEPVIGVTPGTVLP